MREKNRPVQRPQRNRMRKTVTAKVRAPISTTLLRRTVARNQRTFTPNSDCFSQPIDTTLFSSLITRTRTGGEERQRECECVGVCGVRKKS
jgi:hypothetical protein